MSDSKRGKITAQDYVHDVRKQHDSTRERRADKHDTRELLNR
jgi:hypothetical protein